MNRAAYFAAGAIAGVVFGTLLSVPFNHWYTEHFVRGDDDSNFLVSALLFGFWPISALIGAFVGHVTYRRKLMLRSPSERGGPRNG